MTLTLAPPSILAPLGEQPSERRVARRGARTAGCALAAVLWRVRHVHARVLAHRFRLETSSPSYLRTRRSISTARDVAISWSFVVGRPHACDAGARRPTLVCGPRLGPDLVLCGLHVPVDCASETNTVERVNSMASGYNTSTRPPDAESRPRTSS